MNLQRSTDNEEDAIGVRRIENNPTEALTTPDGRGNAQVRSTSICGSTTPAEIQRIRERLLRTQRAPRPSTIGSFNRRQKLALISLSLVDFVSFCSMSIMAPFFPREAEFRGMPESISGLVFSFYAIVMFLSAPVFGIIASITPLHITEQLYRTVLYFRILQLPKVGAKFLFITGLMVAGICNVLFGFLDAIVSYTSFVIFCFLIRGLEALGASAFSTASYIFVVEIFPENIGGVLGILETFVGLGMSTGPAIGGLLYSIGGFGLPFYVLGGVLVAVAPLNFCLIPAASDCRRPTRRGSLVKLLKIPAVLVIGSVVVVASSTWSFLDPTLEPHLRQFNLSTKQIGLIFLLFSALYGICSPFWGWMADKTHSHWSMMAMGLTLSSAGLALLGPSSLLPFLPNALWSDMLALSTLGVSVSLTLLPTFQSILASAIRGGCADELSTYSMVAGIWSCVYSLGEVVGPSLGGFLLEKYGFSMCSTVMAALSLSLAVITTLFFSVKRCDGSRSSGDGGNSVSKDSGIQSAGSLSCSGSFRANNKSERTSLLRKNSDPGMNRARERTADWDTEATDFRGTVSVPTVYGACEA